MSTTPARLNSAVIQRALTSFPHAPSWQTLLCRSLRLANGRRGWTAHCRHLDGEAGLYAFLLPRDQFPNHYTSELDGPAKRKILFHFCVEDLPAVEDRYFVAYVGRTANLLQRLQWHFQSHEKSTAAQVRKALIKCGYVKDTAQAIDFMLEHGRIVYCLLPGDANVAHRDIIEVALWAQYRCPFNIKSER